MRGFTLISSAIIPFSLTFVRHPSQRILGHCCRQPGWCGKFNRTGGRKEKEERGKEGKGSLENERLDGIAKHAGSGWSCGAQSQFNFTVKRVRADILCARIGEESLDIISFNFHTLYEFRFSDWLICTTWYWVVTKQPPWRHYRGVIAVV